MTKRLMLLTVTVCLLIASAFAQDAGSKKKSLDQVLASQNENLLLLGMERGNDKVKADCLSALAKKYEGGGSSDTNSLAKIIQYAGYGVNYAAAIRGFQQDSTWIVRREAAIALARIKSDKAVPNLIDVLRREREPIVKINIIFALGEIGSPIAVPVLLDTLRLAQQQNVLYEAVVSLGKIGDKSAFVELLNIAQEDRNLDVVRQASVEAIDKIKW
ncbi:MAG: HEAT repeat domain-containing protein [Spirochaetes bacterium]|nr:HEAT repeat domain-containing protein [Spirochaetota bacterium]